MKLSALLLSATHGEKELGIDPACKAIMQIADQPVSAWWTHYSWERAYYIGQTIHNDAGELSNTFYIM